MVFSKTIPTTVLITGATGFVGNVLVNKLMTEANIVPRITSRSPIKQEYPPHIQILPPSNLAFDTNWQAALEGCDVVIHTAARVHVMKETAKDSLNEFRKINVAGTLNLAQQAATNGVKRFIFISSIKVNGEFTPKNQFFSADDKAAPQDAYALSKYEAEQQLLALAKTSGMEVVIIRPPLIYGPGVKGNFQRMISWLKKGIPLPLASIKNKRSFVAIENLISLIISCIEHQNAANQIFLVSDGEDLSTPELLKKMGHVINKPPLLLPVPYWLLHIIASSLKKKDMLQRLSSSLQIDISKTRQLLDWSPIITIHKGLELVAKDS